jgi:hypothetical protein
MADISGKISNNVSADIGLKFLEGFLDILTSIGIGGKIHDAYEASGTKAAAKIDFLTFSSFSDHSKSTAA